MGVEVHEGDLRLLESALSEEMTFDAREGLVGIVVGLLQTR